MKKIGRLERPNNNGSAKMFANPVLERLSRTHISIPIIMFLCLSVFSLYYGISTKKIPFWESFSLIIGGFLSWTFLEYMMHRYVYHMIPDSKWKDKIQYSMHGVHHDYPKDKDRLAMPPFVTGFYAAIFYFVFDYALGDYALFFLPGFLSGYALYLGVHFIVHAYQPPKNLFKTLWINHSIHHYKDPDVAFGVSTPLWDYIFRTVPKKH
ncbi:MAG: sterol desaturase family protein [Cyclobacteriaceae bacterium]